MLDYKTPIPSAWSEGSPLVVTIISHLHLSSPLLARKAEIHHCLATSLSTVLQERLKKKAQSV